MSLDSSNSPLKPDASIKPTESTLYTDLFNTAKPDLLLSEIRRLLANDINPDFDICSTGDGPDKTPAATVKTPEGFDAVFSAINGDVEDMGKAFRTLPPSERKAVIATLNRMADTHPMVNPLVKFKDENGKITIDRSLTNNGRTSGAEKIVINYQNLDANGRPKTTYQLSEKSGAPFKDCDPMEVCRGLRQRLDKILDDKLIKAVSSGDKNAVGEAVEALVNTAYHSGWDQPSAWDAVKTRVANAVSNSGDTKVALTGFSAGKTDATRVITLESGSKSFVCTVEPDVSQKPLKAKPPLRFPGIVLTRP